LNITDKKPLPIASQSKSKEFVPDKFKEVAGSMEQQFSEMMLQEMHKTIDRTEPENNAETFDKSLQTQEYAKSLSNGDDGTGLKKMILDQIYPQHMRNEINFRRFQGQQLAANQPKMPKKPEQQLIQGKELNHE